MNRVELIGNITKDLELRTTSNGVSVSKFSIAVNQGYGEEQKTDFLNCIAWRKQAENLCKYCDKGSKIAIEGKLQSYSYEDGNGNKKYGMQVIADNITFLDNKKSKDSAKNVTEEKEDPFKDFASEVELEDNDIPWLN